MFFFYPELTLVLQYVDYHKCVNAKGEDFAPCKQACTKYYSPSFRLLTRKAIVLPRLPIPLPQCLAREVGLSARYVALFPSWHHILTVQNYRERNLSRQIGRLVSFLEELYSLRIAPRGRCGVAWCIDLVVEMIFLHPPGVVYGVIPIRLSNHLFIPSLVTRQDELNYCFGQTQHGGSFV